MKLYHGTVYDIDSIDLSKSNSAKDFGKGFYLSPDKSQAERWAIFKSMQLSGTPNLHYSYSFLLQGLTGSISAQCSLFLFESRIYYILHRHCCAHADALPFSPFVTEQYE